MELDLIQALLADAAVSALVADRISWNVRPQGESAPSVVLQRITSGRSYTMTGASRLAGPLVQADVWAASATEMLAVRDALVAALHGLSAPPFQRCFVEAERQSFEPGEGPDEIHFHHASLDVRVWHHPA